MASAKHDEHFMAHMLDNIPGIVYQFMIDSTGKNPYKEKI